MTANPPHASDAPEKRPMRAATATLLGVITVAALGLATVLALPERNPVTTTAPAVAATPTGNTTEVTVSVEGMSFTPSVIDVPAGDRLLLTFTNTGDQQHDLALATGAATRSLAPGESETIDAGVISADVDGWCTLPGHRQMGMVLRVHAVGAEGAEGAEAPASGHAAHSGTGTAPVAVPTAAELLAHAKEEDAHPAELAPAPSGTVHRETLRVSELSQHLTDSVSRALWTFGGTSPGPTLHGKVGDTFVITLVNDGTMGHSIDFHAGDVAPDAPMRTIAPGESLEYTFVARRAGIWMYHCSTHPMSLHIANGMYGAVVIDPPDLAPVDREYVVVAGEAYLGGNGASADATKLAGLVPDLASFNGRPFQYDAHPLGARIGERVRMWVLNAGPNQTLAFHVVGAQFDTVWTEGAFTLRNGLGSGKEAGVGATSTAEGGAQVLPLVAAQGGYVEFTPHEEGHYAFVNHAMSMAEKGQHGVLEVTP